MQILNFYQKELITMQIRALKIITAVLLATISPIADQQLQPPKDLTTRIDKLIRPAVEADLFSGIILVARGDDILYHEPFGYADWELRAPLTRESRVGIGSITKSMTDIIVELLVAEGQLDLDTPIEHFINGFPRGPEGGVATVRHLYTHRSGVPASQPTWTRRNPSTLGTLSNA